MTSPPDQMTLVTEPKRKRAASLHKRKRWTPKERRTLIRELSTPEWNIHVVARDHDRSIKGIWNEAAKHRDKGKLPDLPPWSVVMAQTDPALDTPRPSVPGDTLNDLFRDTDGIYAKKQTRPVNFITVSPDEPTPPAPVAVPEHGESVALRALKEIRTAQKAWISEMLAAKAHVVPKYSAPADAPKAWPGATTLRYVLEIEQCSGPDAESALDEVLSDIRDLCVCVTRKKGSTRLTRGGARVVNVIPASKTLPPTHWKQVPYGDQKIRE